MIRRPARERLLDVAAALLVVAALVILALPLVAWVLARPFDVAGQGGRLEGTLIPAAGRAIAAAAGVSAAAMAVCMPAGHVLARRRFAGRWLLLGTASAALLAPAALGVTGWVQAAALLGARAAAWPATFATFGWALPAALWLATLAFARVPAACEDAARLDGLGPWRTWWRVSIPLAGGALAGVGSTLFAAVLGEQVVATALGAGGESPLAGALLAGIPPESGEGAALAVLLAIPAIAAGAFGLPRAAGLLAQSIE